MTAPDPATVWPGTQFAMTILHPGPPALRIRYREGVLVDPYGFPDWSLCARVVLALPPPPAGLTRDEVRVLDVLAANAAMADAAGGQSGDPLWSTAGRGTVGTPAGWCWAHLGGTRRLALVPIELHAAYRHVGGVSTMPVAGRGLRVDAQPVPVGPAPGDEVPEDLLDVLERMLGWPLPAAYRRFLSATNGAGPAAPAVLPGWGFVADQPLFGIAREDRQQDLSYVGGLLRDRLTLDFLPIGYVQGGLLAVKVSGDDQDSVWYHDDDDPRDREAYGPELICSQLLHRCADNIDDFWASLVRPATFLTRLAATWVETGQISEVRDDLTGSGLPAAARPPWQAGTGPARDSLTTLFQAG